MAVASARPPRYWFACFMAAIFAMCSPAPAEQVDCPLSVLREAPYQLEVTVLSVEEKNGPHSGQTLGFHVRVDRVLVGSGLNEGQETAVVSVRYDLPPRSTGTRGDRGPFTGVGGLPIKGDKARLYASGSPDVLKSIPPNGWQRSGGTVALIGADQESHAERVIPELARLVSAGGLGTGGVSVHLAADSDGIGAPEPKPQADAKTYFMNQGRLRGSGGTVVLSATGLRPSYGSYLPDALQESRELVALRGALGAFDADVEAKTEFAKAYTRALGASEVGRAAPGTQTRVLPPDSDAAKHPILAGVKIPADGLIVGSPLIHVGPMAEGCRVLLWGEAVGDGTKKSKQPLLWVREVPRARKMRQEDWKGDLPARHIVVTTLGDASDVLSQDAAGAEVRLLLVQAIAWASGEYVEESARAKVRGSAIEAAQPSR